MESEKRVSVIVPVFNNKDYLICCVNSLLGQTYKSIEIILVDDGSTDGSGKLCDELEVGHTNITVIHQKNGGQQAARKAVPTFCSHCSTWALPSRFPSRIQSVAAAILKCMERPTPLGLSASISITRVNWSRISHSGVSILSPETRI